MSVFATKQSSSMVRKSLIGTGLGNALEWFDWQIYATFAPFIALQMFRSQDPISALLSTLAIFAVGFIARPFGGLLFGWISDRHGRKVSLLLAIGLASIGSVIIAVIPSFTVIGNMASLLLLVARLIQGLAHGGEMPSAQTFLSESAPKEHRGLWSSIVYVSGTTGILLATIIGAILTTFLPEQFMSQWGWRVPFLIAAILGLYTLVLRTRLKETDSFAAARSERADDRISFWRQLIDNRIAVIKVVGLTLGFTVSFYVWAVTPPAYASEVLGMDTSSALWAGLVGNALFIICLPLWGALSDRIGRKPVMLIGLLGSAISYWPMNSIMTDKPWTLIVSMTVVLFFLSAVAAISPAVYSELFPTGVRTLGTALPYAFSVALFGGTAPYLQTWFASIGADWLFPTYAIVLLLISAAVVLSLLETRGIDLSKNS